MVSNIWRKIENCHTPNEAMKAIMVSAEIRGKQTLSYTLLPLFGLWVVTFVLKYALNISKR